MTFRYDSLNWLVGKDDRVLNIAANAQGRVVIDVLHDGQVYGITLDKGAAECMPMRQTSPAWAPWA
jgi:hypothetical protein